MGLCTRGHSNVSCSTSVTTQVRRALGLPRPFHSSSPGCYFIPALLKPQIPLPPASQADDLALHFTKKWGNFSVSPTCTCLSPWMGNPYATSGQCLHLRESPFLLIHTRVPQTSLPPLLPQFSPVDHSQQHIRYFFLHLKKPRPPNTHTNQPLQTISYFFLHHLLSHFFSLCKLSLKRIFLTISFLSSCLIIPRRSCFLPPPHLNFSYQSHQYLTL